MYPSLFEFFQDMFGIEIGIFRVVQMFGFFVAVAFIIGAWVMVIELKRKEEEGLVFPEQRKVQIGAMASLSDLVINFIIGFLIGFKLLPMITDFDGFANDPQGFILSSQGSFAGGLIVAALLTAYKYIDKNRKKLPKPEWKEIMVHPHELVGDIVILAMITGLLGAKIFHNLEYWDDFVRDPIGSLLSFSGLTYYGGLIFGAGAVIWFARKHKLSIRHLSDVMAPTLMIAYAVGRIGCQMSGDGDWGIQNEAEIPGMLSFLPDWMWSFNYPHNVVNEGELILGCVGNHCSARGVPVWPTPFYETLMCSALFVVLWVMRKRITIPGALFAIYLVMNGVERFLIEKIRVNIGIHEGEVVFQGNDVFGDGVNIASRIQAIAPPGGIWVSEPVSRNVQNKTGISTAFIREEVLRNVKDSVKIYEVKIETDVSPIGLGIYQSAASTNSLFTKIKPIHIGVTVGMLIVVFLVNMNFNAGGRADAVIEHSIAVLPFDNFSQDKEKNQYLCDGFMEEIINHLSRINELPVPTRSDVDQYREAKPARPEIGHQLGVSHLLEGNLQRIGDSLKVDVRIFLAKESQIIWQDSYHEKMAAVFKMQSSIAKDVAEQLEIGLTAREERRIETPPTENLKAWDTYITANQYAQNWYRNHVKKDYKFAITLYQKAEREDPTFAQPVEARASIYRFGAEYSELRQEIDMDSILILCNRAIALDSNLAEAYSERRAYWQALGEKSRAESDMLKARELDPIKYASAYGLFIFRNKDYIYGLQLMHQSEKFTTVHGRRRWHYRSLGHCYLQMGDTEQAWHYYDLAQFLGGPDDFYGLVSQIMLAQCLRDWDKSYDLLQKFQSYHPTNKLTFGLLGSHYLQTNNYKKALGYFEHAATLSYEGRDHDWDVTNLNCFHGMALWLNGKKEEGEKLINEALAAYLKLDYVRLSDREVRIAGIYAFLGDKEEAYYWLRKSRWTQNALYEINQDIWFSNISGEEEFKDIVNAVKEERLEFREKIARLKAEGKWELK